MADIAEERGLGPIQFGKALRTLLLFLIGSRIGKAGSNLSGKQGNEAVVVGIRLPIGIEGSHQKARRPLLSLLRDRNDHRLLRWFIPGAAGKFFKSLWKRVYECHRLIGQQVMERPESVLVLRIYGRNSKRVS